METQLDTLVEKYLLTERASTAIPTQEPSTNSSITCETGALFRGLWHTAMIFCCILIYLLKLSHIKKHINCINTS